MMVTGRRGFYIPKCAHVKTMTSEANKLQQRTKSDRPFEITLQLRVYKPTCMQV